MTTPFLVPFDLSAIEPTDAAIAKDRTIRGAPSTRTWNVEKTPDGLALSGLWEATPGAWQVEYDKWEFCTILSGRSVLHEEGGKSVSVAAGDAFVIRPSFRGVREVLETTGKLYVIRRTT